MVINITYLYNTRHKLICHVYVEKEFGSEEYKFNLSKYKKIY